MTLLCLGARCWMTTKDMLALGGTWEKNPSRASRPPAEAPIPTTTGRDPSFVPETAFFFFLARMIIRLLGKF